MKRFRVSITEEAERELLKTLPDDSEITPEVLADLLRCQGAEYETGYEHIDRSALHAGVLVRAWPPPEIASGARTNLQGKLCSLKLRVAGEPFLFRIVPKDEWEDDLSAQLREEGFATSWKNNILLVESAEIAQVSIAGIPWQVCYQWVPLFRIINWFDCLMIAEPDTYYAIPCNEAEEGEEASLRQLGYGLLHLLGFETATFEGF